MSAPNPITLSYLGAIPGSFTGSISAASNQLTLTTSNHGIKPGHDIIVETGGEEDGGEIGTFGVGGAWPSRSFADEATLLASTPDDEIESDSSATAAWAIDTGEVFYRAAAAWTQPLAKYLELRYAIPLALRARVIAVSGAVLTLNTTATVASSGASVYVDSYRALYRASGSPGSVVRVDGEYALGYVLSSIGADGIELVGDGVSDSRIFNPRGCPWLTLRFNSSPNLRIGQMELERQWTGQAIWKGMIGYRPPGDFPNAQVVQAHSSSGASLRNLRIRNGLLGSAFIRLSNDATIQNVEAIHRDVYLRYYGSQWAIVTSDCARTGIVDCSFDDDVLSEALEIHAGSDCFVSGFTARNGLCASNSNINCDYSGLNFTIDNTAGAERSALETFNAQGLCNWNNHFSLAAEGGSLSNSTFTIDPSTPAEIATQVPSLFARHSALSGALDAITMGPNVELVTNGMLPRAILAPDPGSSVQDLNLNGVQADALIELGYGSVANTTGTELKYCPGNVTLGSGNDFDTLTEHCA